MAKSSFSTKGKDELAYERALGKHEEILVDKVVYLDGVTFGERMVERKDGHEPVGRKGNLFELRLDGAAVTDEGQVNVPRAGACA